MIDQRKTNIWSMMSLREKSEAIRRGISEGKNLEDIRNEYAEGGTMSYSPIRYGTAEIEMNRIGNGLGDYRNRYSEGGKIDQYRLFRNGGRKSTNNVDSAMDNANSDSLRIVQNRNATDNWGEGPINRRSTNIVDNRNNSAVTNVIEERNDTANEVSSPSQEDYIVDNELRQNEVELDPNSAYDSEGAINNDRVYVGENPFLKGGAHFKAALIGRYIDGTPIPEDKLISYYNEFNPLDDENSQKSCMGMAMNKLVPYISRSSGNIYGFRQGYYSPEWERIANMYGQQTRKQDDSVDGTTLDSWEWKDWAEYMKYPIWFNYTQNWDDPNRPVYTLEQDSMVPAFPLYNEQTRDNDYMGNRKDLSHHSWPGFGWTSEGKRILSPYGLGYSVLGNSKSELFDASITNPLALYLGGESNVIDFDEMDRLIPILKDEYINGKYNNKDSNPFWRSEIGKNLINDMSNSVENYKEQQKRFYPVRTVTTLPEYNDFTFDKLNTWLNDLQERSKYVTDWSGNLNNQYIKNVFSDPALIEELQSYIREEDLSKDEQEMLFNALIGIAGQETGWGGTWNHPLNWFERDRHDGITVDQANKNGLDLSYWHMIGAGNYKARKTIDRGFGENLKRSTKHTEAKLLGNDYNDVLFDDDIEGWDEEEIKKLYEDAGVEAIKNEDGSYDKTVEGYYKFNFDGKSNEEIEKIHQQVMKKWSRKHKKDNTILWPIEVRAYKELVAEGWDPKSEGFNDLLRDRQTKIRTEEYPNIKDDQTYNTWAPIEVARRHGRKDSASNEEYAPSMGAFSQKELSDYMKKKGYHYDGRSKIDPEDTNAQVMAAFSMLVENYKRAQKRYGLSGQNAVDLATVAHNSSSKFNSLDYVKHYIVDKVLKDSYINKVKKWSNMYRLGTNPKKNGNNNIKADGGHLYAEWMQDNANKQMLEEIQRNWDNIQK